MIKGLIFDMDGVILDSLTFWMHAGERYLKGIGIETPPDLGELLFSMSLEQGAVYLRKNYLPHMSEADILQGILDATRDAYYYEIQAKKGATELLHYLQKKNIPAVAATSSPRDHVTAALQRLQLLDMFKAIYTTTEVGVSKHSPDIYLQALESLGGRAEETIVVEDSLYALKTAKAAGFITVGVRDENGEPLQQELADTADYYLQELTCFKELPIL